MGYQTGPVTGKGEPEHQEQMDREVRILVKEVALGASGLHFDPDLGHTESSCIVWVLICTIIICSP